MLTYLNLLAQSSFFLKNPSSLQTNLSDELWVVVDVELLPAVVELLSVDVELLSVDEESVELEVVDGVVVVVVEEDVLVVDEG